MNATTQTTVGQLVAEHPQRSRVFEKLGIEYCCGGKLTLEEACTNRGLDAQTVLNMLEATEGLSADSDPDPSAMNLTALCDHIVSTHHAYLREELPRLANLTHKVASVHGADYPWLHELREVYMSLADELSSHMMKEEKMLFPAIRNLEAGQESGAPFGNTLSAPIGMMEHEHESAGAALSRLRQLSQGYRPPEQACNSFRAMLDGLAQLERDTHHHISKENNILFPRAIAAFQPSH